MKKIIYFFICLFIFFIFALPFEARTSLHVYITVDDGPIKGTQKIVDVATKLSCPISFMMVGKHVEASKERKKLLKELKLNPLILVGNHSYSHGNGNYKFFYKNPERVLKDFKKNQDLLNATPPVERSPIKIGRLPGRNVWTIGTRKAYDFKDGMRAATLLKEKGYFIFGWDLEWRHNSKTGHPIQSVAQLVHEVVKKADYAFIPGHVVILMHDQMFHTPAKSALLEEFLEELKKRGAIFRTLAQYPGR